jgi:hypothetical protein
MDEWDYPYIGGVGSLFDLRDKEGERPRLWELYT